MPRKKQRFSKLFEQLRANGGVPSGTGKLNEFHKYLIGTNKVTQDNKIPPEARKLFSVGIIPFSLTPTGETPDQRYVASMSAYSIKGLEARANANEADLGIYKIEGGESVNASFYPALIKASYNASSSAAKPEKVSQITGEKYPYKYARTFSFPFGRVAKAEDAKTGVAGTNIKDADPLDVFRDVQAKLKAGTDAQLPKSISYEPELFRTESNGIPYETNTDVGTFSVA